MSQTTTQKTERTAAAPQVRSGSAALREFFATFVIVASIGIGILLYVFVLGNPANFEGNDPRNHPIQGNYLGIAYKGGFLVPIAIGLLLITITMSIERAITLSRASGKMSMESFVQQIEYLIDQDRIDEAIALCDKQRGTVGNVVRETLTRLKQVKDDSRLDKDQKIAAVQKALEESLALELPMLEKHMTIIATIVSIATLVGLIGTVLGMIRAFAALATSGAPDAVALATGISEALVNTALGITTSTLATILYNYFTSRIDDITYRIDEAGYIIVQTLQAKI
ncbi:MAG: MotA/TolQ/ExbB proton channel family protein [Bacteroidia bacterium]|nr:MotA/TolQ/ExbB proton channel family protein [Bacteroidia bacterium]MCX7764581.1 MotA/TolQ/ExbB proton channel family protein [Bacteroidia bacterium]MDW8056816.1 MotA/TolQ/ExbB proton channel family protein [Bacteroidia bacterium]